MSESLHELLRSTRDERAFETLAGIVRGRDAVAFVGAGMSARVGYGAWDALIAQLAKASSRGSDPQQRHPPEAIARDLAWLADRYRRTLGDEKYFAHLQQYFRPTRRRDAAIHTIVRLPFRFIVTTNYDETLERAWKRHSRHRLRTVTWNDDDAVRDLMCALADRNGDGDRYLVYLHGRWDDPQSIVLSERDYVSRYVSADGTVRKLFAIFSMRPAVFFGFSLEDPDVMAIFRQVHSVHGRARHHAVLPIPDDTEGWDRESRRARLDAKFGVRAIFYETDTNPKTLPAARHARLPKLLEQLDKAVKPASRAGRRATARVAITRAVGTTPWASRPDFARAKGRADPEDPQKGRFGGKARRDGLILDATVKPYSGDPDWFELKIVVTGPRLAGRVRFYLHDTFPVSEYERKVAHRKATLTLGAYGAFTVGAIANDGRTPLELDLATVGPETFRER